MHDISELCNIFPIISSFQSSDNVLHPCSTLSYRPGQITTLWAKGASKISPGYIKARVFGSPPTPISCDWPIHTTPSKRRLWSPPDIDCRHPPDLPVLWIKQPATDPQLARQPITKTRLSAHSWSSTLQCLNDDWIQKPLSTFVC